MLSKKNHNAKSWFRKFTQNQTPYRITKLYVRTAHCTEPRERRNASRYHKTTDNEIYVHLCYKNWSFSLLPPKDKAVAHVCAPPTTGGGSLLVFPLFVREHRVSKSTANRWRTKHEESG